MKKKIDEWVEKKWKDPVWSKVIANAIWYGPMAAIGALAFKVWASIDLNSFVKFKDFIISALKYKSSIPVWHFLVGLLLLGVIIWLYRQVMKRLAKRTFNSENAIFEEMIGDYKFRDLYQILYHERLLVKTQKMRDNQIGPPNASLLELFGYYRHIFNDGLKNSVEKIIGYQNYEEDGGYLIDVVAPKLLSYKLVDKIEQQGFVINHSVLYITYETSQIGYKFFDCWDRLSSIQHNR